MVARGEKIMMVGTQSGPVPIDFHEDQRSHDSDFLPLLQYYPMTIDDFIQVFD